MDNNVRPENMERINSKELADAFINEQVEKEMSNLIQEGIHVDNINMLGKLVDIHKDLANEEYWEET